LFIDLLYIRPPLPKTYPYYIDLVHVRKRSGAPDLDRKLLKADLGQNCLHLLQLRPFYTSQEFYRDVNVLLLDRFQISS